MLLFSPFRLDPFNQRLWRGELRVPLKPKAFAVLCYLAERPQRCEELALSQLEPREDAAFLDARFAPHHLPPELGWRLRAHTAGNPLFLARVVDTMVKRDQVQEVGGSWQLCAELAAVTEDVPPSVTALLEGELARLTELERDVLGAASVAGVEFWVAAVAAALALDLVSVEDLCVRWARAGRFLRLREPSGSGLRCEFIHALYQRVLLASLSPGRKTHLHGRIAVWLEATFAGEPRSGAAELAMHFERGPEPNRAIRHHEIAGKLALARCAYREAIAHLNSAQVLNERLPAGEERLRNELSLLLVLGIPAAMISGYASEQVESVYLRARDLCRELGEPQRLLQIAVGLSTCYLTRGAYAQAKELAEHAERLALAENAAAARQEANLVQLMASFHLGELGPLRVYMARAVELYGSERGGSAGFSLAQDLSVATATLLSWPLWLLGHPEQALERGEQALQLATPRCDDFATAKSLGYLVGLHVLRGEWELCKARAALCRQLSIEHGFRFFQTTALLGEGAARVEQGALERGAALLQEGWQGRRALGATINSGLWCTLLADAHGRRGDFAQALAALDEACGLVAAHQERWWEPELQRQLGELALRGRARATELFAVRPPPEAAFERALELARSMAPLRSSCAPLPAWRGCGPERAGSSRRESCSAALTPRSAKASTRPIYDARESCCPSSGVGPGREQPGFTWEFVQSMLHRADADGKLPDCSWSRAKARASALARWCG